MGVSDLPLCRPWDVLCQLARAAARRGVYSNYAQENLVQVRIETTCNSRRVLPNKLPRPNISETQSDYPNT